MRDRFDDCIFCGGKNGSAEHLVLAALGGLRTDRGVLCSGCNGSFSELDSALANDMRPLNAMVGVRHGRTKDPLRTEVHDAETGRSYVLSEGRQIQHAAPLVLQDKTVDGVRNVYAVASTQEQADEFVRQMRAEGKPLTVTRERVPLLFASPPRVNFTFGGPVTFRALARVALNILAHHYPSMAREPWLDPIKRFIRQGNGDAACVTYEYRDTSTATAEPPDSFAFQHRFLLGRDAGTGLVYARVSLLGVIELTVRFGATAVQHSETLIDDVDVTAASPPDDVRVQRFAGIALMQPGQETKNPPPYWNAGMAMLARKRADVLWEQDAPDLLERMNAARDLAPPERHRQIASLLEGQRQRLLNLAAYVRINLKQHMTEQLGEWAGDVADALGVLVQGEGKSKTGVTELTKVHTDMLCFVMADALVKILAERPLTDLELRLMLEGGPGAAVVCGYMAGELQKSHPMLRS